MVSNAVDLMDLFITFFFWVIIQHFDNCNVEFVWGLTFDGNCKSIQESERDMKEEKSQA